MVLLRGKSLFLFCAGWTKYNLDDMVKVCVDFLAWSSLSLRNHLDERVKDFGKVLVAVLVSCIDACVLIIKLHSTCDCLGKSESRCISLVVTKIGPQLWCDMFCHKGVS